MQKLGKFNKLIRMLQLADTVTLNKTPNLDKLMKLVKIVKLAQRVTLGKN